MRSSKIRLITDNEVSPSEGLSVDEALANLAPTRSEHDSQTLRLYTYANHALLVGRYQRIESEINLSAMQNEPLVKLNRRPTGGGTILMGSDQLGIAFTYQANDTWSPRESLRDFGHAISFALSSLGIDARLRGKNDLEVNGKKICGLGIYKDKSGGVLNHASILFDLDYELLLRMLAIPNVKLAAHRSQNISTRLTTISAELGRGISPVEVVDLVARSLGFYFGSKVSKSTLTDEESALAQDLRTTKYETNDWIFSRTLNKDLEHVSIPIRTKIGTLEVSLELQSQLIKSAIITGDFNLFTSELALIESYLKWQLLERNVLLSRLKDIRESVAHIIEVEDLIQALCTAEARSEISSPIRIGSCYIPEESHVANSI